MNVFNTVDNNFVLGDIFELLSRHEISRLFYSRDTFEKPSLFHLH